MSAPSAAILELNMPRNVAEGESAARRWRVEHWLVLAIAVMTIALGLSFAADPISRVFAASFQQARPQIRLNLDELRRVEEMSVDDKTQIIVEGEEAQVKNAAIPFAAQPLEQVRAFGLAAAAANAETYANALQCLTQAVYYEAAVEPLVGRRAVAQVVLNRVRHPAYPNSVCGVVYQGSTRRTGCQFSFTCDGSLLRGPSQARWREAHNVARAALAGHIESSVGSATHYHADYVLPKWAFQLGKITQIGRHIFYRFNGSWGRSSAFTSRYTGLERIPALDMAALRQRAVDDGLTIDAGVGAVLFKPGLTVPPDVTDRHAETDVGGRIDMTKTWRPSIPDPVASNGRLKALLVETEQPPSPKKVAESGVMKLEIKQ